MAERWLNVEEIAVHLGIAPVTIYRWVEKGKIPSHRVGKFWRFKVSEVDSWVGNGEAELMELKGSKKLNSARNLEKSEKQGV